MNPVSSISREAREASCKEEGNSCTYIMCRMDDVLRLFRFGISSRPVLAMRLKHVTNGLTSFDYKNLLCISKVSFMEKRQNKILVPNVTRISFSAPLKLQRYKRSFYCNTPIPVLRFIVDVGLNSIYMSPIGNVLKSIERNVID